MNLAYLKISFCLASERLNVHFQVLPIMFCGSIEGIRAYLVIGIEIMKEPDSYSI